MINRMSYEKPEVTFWSAGELDAIEATMSGGVGGSTGGSGGSANAKWVAYVYGFDYGDHVNTTAIAGQEEMYLSNMGYTVYINTTVAASFAVGTSPATGYNRMNSGVFVFNGHANAGSCAFNGNASYLTATKSGSPYYKFDHISMSNCKAAFFYGVLNSGLQGRVWQFNNNRSRPWSNLCVWLE
jgi:hypothetical protein